MDSKNKDENFSKAIPELLTRLNQRSRGHISALLKQWISGFLAQSNECIQLCREHQSNTTSQPGPFYLSLQLWQDTDHYVHSLQDWVDKNSLFHQNLAIPVWESFAAAYNDDLAGCPDQVKLEVNDNWWLAREHDSIATKIWKRNHRLHLKLTRSVRGWINKFRVRLKKTPLVEKPQYRTVNVTNFISQYYLVPVYGALVRANRELLQTGLMQQFQLHQSVSSYIAAATPAAELQASVQTQSETELAHALAAAAKNLPDLTTLASNLTTRLDYLLERLQTDLEKIDGQFQIHWQNAGSRILPLKDFEEERVRETWQKLQAQTGADLTRWQESMTVENQDWKKDLELAQLEIHALMIGMETQTAIHTRITDQILPTFKEPLELLSVTLDKFKNLETQQNQGLRQEILSANRLTIRSLRREKIPRIVDALLAAQLGKSLENYLSRTRFVVEKLPEKQTILAETDGNHEKPMAVIPLKHLVQTEIVPELGRSHAQLMASIQKQMDKVTRDLSEIDQIVEYNLGTALDLLEESGERLQESHQVVLDGLQRTINQLESLSQQLQSIDQQVTTELLNIAIAFYQQVQALENNEKIGQLQIRIARAQTREKLKNLRSQFIQQIKTLVPGILSAISRFSSRMSDEIWRIRKITRLGAISEGGEQEFTRYVHQSHARLETMPYVYQRLFRLEPLRDERFYAGREQEMSQIKSAFSAWKEHPYFAIALIGETGSGRTTLLHFIQEQVFRPMPVHTITFNRTLSDPKDLLAELNKTFDHKKVKNWERLETDIAGLEKPVVCIVENIQKLFLRTVNGFEALEQFLLFMTKTQHKVFWVLTFGLYGWQFLDKAIGLKPYFHQIITMQEMSQDMVQSIILKRHRVSGYPLWFEAKPDIEKSNKYKRLASAEAQQHYLQQLFFEQLYRQSQGNISVALLVWLMSIKQVLNDKLVIAPAMEIDVSFLQQMPNMVVFTLAALLQHQSLTVEEHASIFRTSLRDSMTLLENLKNRGLLTTAGAGYRIHDLMYRPIVKNLKINNIIYE